MQAKSEVRESHLMFPGGWEYGRVRELNLHIPKWTPFWELESQWTHEPLESDYRGSKPIKCLKWSRMTHLDSSSTNYDQKKGWESNWQFDSRPLKVNNRPDFLSCRWCATYCWKSLNEGYNLASFQLEVCIQSYMPPKSGESQFWEFRNSHLGVLGQNAIWMLVPWLIKIYTIKRKVVASPNSRPWWVLWIQVCPWLILTPKVFQLCTNQLVVWFCVGLCEWLITCHFS